MGVATVAECTDDLARDAFDVRVNVRSLLWGLSVPGIRPVGKSSARTFHVVHEDMVKRFLKFNLRGNTLLSLGTMILRQGARGVPIGEFLSAQLAEIWCAWREYRSLFAPLDPSTPVSPFEREVRQALNCSCKLRDTTDQSAGHVPRAQCPVCGAMYDSFSLARDVDYTLAPHCAQSMGVSGSILISPTVHTLTDEQVCDTGFTGMWARLTSLSVSSVWGIHR